MVVDLAAVDLIFSIPRPVDHIFHIRSSFKKLCAFFAATMQISGHYCEL